MEAGIRYNTKESKILRILQNRGEQVPENEKPFLKAFIEGKQSLHTKKFGSTFRPTTSSEELADKYTQIMNDYRPIAEFSQEFKPFEDGSTMKDKLNRNFIEALKSPDFESFDKSVIIPNKGDSTFYGNLIKDYVGKNKDGMDDFLKSKVDVLNRSKVGELNLDKLIDFYMHTPKYSDIDSFIERASSNDPKILLSNDSLKHPFTLENIAKDFKELVENIKPQLRDVVPYLTIPVSTGTSFKPLSRTSAERESVTDKMVEPSSLLKQRESVTDKMVEPLSLLNTERQQSLPISSTSQAEDFEKAVEEGLAY